MQLQLITVTSGRPKAFAMLRKWVEAQTMQEFTWLIATDDWEGYKFPRGAKVLKRDQDSNLPSMNANYVHALEHAEADRLILLEDDDYFAPNYIFETNKLLDQADLVGWAEDAYYYCLNRRPYRPHNQTWASLAATAIRKNVTPVLLELARKGERYLDTPLWNTWQGSKLLYHNFWGIPMNSRTGPKMVNGFAEEKPRHVGIKDNWHGGTPGASGHEPKGGWDLTGRELRKWIGSDAEFYLALTKPPEIGTAGILMEMPMAEVH
jgi:hypothetical protein